VLLGHRQVAAPQPGLDVRDRNTGIACGFRPCAGRIGVAEDERPVRSLLLDHGGDGGPHRRGVRGVEVEPVARFG
jgi:hypothetical protein